MHLEHTSHLWASLLFAGTAGAWFAYFRLKERNAKPFFLMLLAIIGGHLSALAAVLVYGRLESWGYSTDWRVMQQSWSRGMPMSLVIGLVEEGTKLIPVLLIVLVSRHVTRAQDGLFLAACAGLGFAVAENVIFSEQGLTMVEGVARAATTPVTHALFAAPWGLGLASFLLKRRPAALILSFGTSVGAHGLYDFLLARPHVPLLASAVVVLGLWVWVIARTAPAVMEAVRASNMRPALTPAAQSAYSKVRPLR